MNNWHKKQHRGAALLLFVILFVLISAALVFAVSRGAYQDLLRYRAFAASKEAFFAAQAGVEDAIYRHRHSLNYASPATFTVDDVAITVTRTISGTTFAFTAEGVAESAYRTAYMELLLGSGASFSYGLQSDTGGIVMENSSSVLGNIYSNGTVLGTGGGPDGNDVFGTIISAGSGGSVTGVHATGSVFANHIQTTVVDKNAFCESIDNSYVTGDLHCESVSATTPSSADFPAPPANQPTTTLPISDSMIEDYKAAAAAGEIIASTSSRCSGGTFVIDSSTTTGPAKIECNVSVEKNGTIWSLGGYIWVEGDFITKTGVPEVRIDSTDPDLEGKALPIVVDDESDQITSSRIELRNSAKFVGYGDDSYIILISENNAEKNGSPELAINSQQSAFGDVLLYAKDGEILIEQSGQYVGIAAELIRLQNSTQIIYETGAISLEFPDGPGGGFEVARWEEVK